MTNEEAARILEQQKNKFLDEWVDFGGVTEVYKKAIALLNIQEATEWIQISPAKIYECKQCGQQIMTNDISSYKYCHGCGRKVK